VFLSTNYYSDILFLLFYLLIITLTFFTILFTNYHSDIVFLLFFTNYYSDILFLLLYY
jgi:hypothetical protein